MPRPNTNDDTTYGPIFVCVFLWMVGCNWEQNDASYHPTFHRTTVEVMKVSDLSGDETQ